LALASLSGATIKHTSINAHKVFSARDNTIAFCLASLLI